MKRFKINIVLDADTDAASKEQEELYAAKVAQVILDINWPKELKKRGVKKSQLDVFTVRAE